MEEFVWSQKYRPERVSDCILPDRLKNIFQSYVDSKAIPTLMLTGGPGIGKTTVALAMCNELGYDNLFINASRERGIDTLRTKITNYATTVSLTGNLKAVILDEADRMTPEAQDALRGIIEEVSSNCSFILTCNHKARIIDPIHSRCAVIDFSLKNDEKSKLAAELLKRIRFILESEGVEYEKDVLVELIKKFFPDYRRCINELQRYVAEGQGKIDSGLLSHVFSIEKINDLVKHLKAKSFINMRKWVVANSDVDPNTIYRAIYDSMYEYVDKSSIPPLVLILSKYQYQAAFVADQEINLVACLTEILVECTFK